MRALVLIGLVGCDSGAPRNASEPVPPAPPSPIVVTAAVDASLESPRDGYRPNCDCAVSEVQPAPAPESVRNAPVWIGRTYLTGQVPAEHTLTIYTLQRDDTQGLLTMEVREEQHGGEWHVGAVGEWSGRISQTGNRITFTPFEHPGRANGPTLVCKRTKLKAAAATAVRAPSPRAGECDGDEGRWVPARTKAIEALHCTADPHEWNQIALAPSPGIEWLHVNDDCSMQGGGWRAVANDGAIAKVRK